MTSLFRKYLTLGYSIFITAGDVFSAAVKNSFFYDTLSKVSILYFCIDSLSNSKEYVIHHFAATLMMIGGAGTSCDLSRPIRLYHMLATLEYSTIFLNLYRMNRSNLYKTLFVVSFLYYRTYHFSRWYFLENWDADVGYICTDHLVYSEEVCNNVFRFGILSLECLNLFWSTLIFKKLII